MACIVVGHFHKFAGLETSRIASGLCMGVNYSEAYPGMKFLKDSPLAHYDISGLGLATEVRNLLGTNVRKSRKV
jgi:hypothetical protein